MVSDGRSMGVYWYKFEYFNQIILENVGGKYSIWMCMNQEKLGNSCDSTHIKNEWHPQGLQVKSNNKIKKNQKKKI